MLSYNLWNMHVKLCMTCVQVTCDDHVLLVKEFGTVFVKDLLILVYFVF
jgi:hypothetical protein